MKFEIWGKVRGLYYLGFVEADDEKSARDCIAWEQYVGQMPSNLEGLEGTYIEDVELIRRDNRD